MLYAIRNGGFSGAIMPQNIVTGAQAQEVAAFVAKYAGAGGEDPARRSRWRRGAAAPAAAEPAAGVLDLRLIRAEPDLVRAALARRGADGPLDEMLALDERRPGPAHRGRGAARRAEPGLGGHRRGQAGGRGRRRRDRAMREVASRVKALQAELDEVQAGPRRALALLPNLPAEDAPPEDDGDQGGGRRRAAPGATTSSSPGR